MFCYRSSSLTADRVTKRPPKGHSITQRKRGNPTRTTLSFWVPPLGIVLALHLVTTDHRSAICDFLRVPSFRAFLRTLLWFLLAFPPFVPSCAFQLLVPSCVPSFRAFLRVPAVGAFLRVPSFGAFLRSLLWSLLVFLLWCLLARSLLLFLLAFQEKEGSKCWGGGSATGVAWGRWGLWHCQPNGPAHPDAIQCAGSGAVWRPSASPGTPSTGPGLSMAFTASGRWASCVRVPCLSKPF